MIKFSQEKVLLLHKLLVEQTGGSDGIRDFGLLDSALESAYATFGGEDLFPTKEEKAARIGVGLVSNHAFVDGNKRIGMYVMLTFLEVNGIPIDATDEEVVEVGLRLAEGKMQYEELLQWILYLEHRTICLDGEIRERIEGKSGRRKTEEDGSLAGKYR